MGGKRRLASKIVDKIMLDNPNCKYFYDLFGGGGAVSFEAMQRGLNVTYNELNSGVVKLLEKIRVLRQESQRLSGFSVTSLRFTHKPAKPLVFY